MTFGNPWIVGTAVMTLALGIGVVASRLSSRKTPHPRERAFVVRTCLLTWTLIGLFIVSIITLKPPFRYALPAILVLAIPALHYRWSMRRQLIRRIEEREYRPRR